MTTAINELTNGIILPMVSMAKIEGEQKASKTLSSVWLSTLDIVPYPSVDVMAITTAGLYENTPSKQPHLARQEKLKSLNKFNRSWQNTIAARAKADDIIKPQAYNVNTWDAILHDPNILPDFVSNYGRLRNAFSNNADLQKALNNLAEVQNRDLTEGQVAFWLEEYAQIFGVVSNQIEFPLKKDSLRTDLSGARLLMYPGAIDQAALMSIRILAKQHKLNLEEGKSFWLDVSVPAQPKFTDIAIAVK